MTKTPVSSKRIKDTHLMDMLKICRDSSENNHFLVKGLNLSFRECPYVLLINLKDLEGRFDNVLSSRDLESFKSMLKAIGHEMLGSVLLLEHFMGHELLNRRIPIISKIFLVMKDLKLQQENLPKVNKETNIFTRFDSS